MAISQPARIHWQHGFWLIVLSGLMQIFSFPNFLLPGYACWHGWLALFSLIPFIYVWRRTSWEGAFTYAWIMGLIYFTGILAWIRLIGRNTNIDNAVAWIFFAVCGGVYFGLFSLSAHLTRRRLKLSDAVVLPLAWVAWEYLRGHVLANGWPWGSLGHTQYSNPLIRQMASVVGVSGISFIIVFINIILTNILEKILSVIKEKRSFSWSGFFPELKALPASFKTQPFQASLSAGLLLLWIVLVSMALIQEIQFAKTKKSRVDLALLQGNINTRQKWDRNYRTTAMKKMTFLHLMAAQQTPDLIVWAESCFPGILEHPAYQEWEEQLRALIQQGGRPTLLTSNEYQQEKNLDARPSWHHYNSAFYMGSQAQTLGRYRKVYLVPFGEYIPYEFLKRHLKAVVQEPIPMDFEPGDDYTVFSLGQIGFSVLICYEDVFEELCFHLAQEGADLFLGVGNNSWSGKSAMSYQHTAMSVFVAVEHRAYVAKADMTGPTCVIDPWGNIGEPVDYFTEGVKFETIYPSHFKTFFTRFGNIVPFFFLLLFFSLFATVFFKPKK